MFIDFLLSNFILLTLNFKIMLNFKKNASRTTNSRSAFTLIELSIVLIIIGLLVAGITGGAALINAAKLRSVMTDANANKIAANNFYSQYAALPGDFNKVISNDSKAGNKDGLIQFMNDLATTVDETQNALQHLIDTGIISNEGFDFTSPTTTPTPVYHYGLIPGTNIPQQKDYSGLGFIFVGEENAATGLNENFVLGTGATTSTFTNEIDTGAGSIFKGEDALAIDAKMDDGVISTGDVRGFAGADTVGTIGPCSYDEDEVLCAIGWKLDIPTDI